MKHGRRPPARAGDAPRRGAQGSAQGGAGKRFDAKKPRRFASHGPGHRADENTAPRRFAKDEGASTKPFRGGPRKGFHKSSEERPEESRATGSGTPDRDRRSHQGAAWRPGERSFRRGPDDNTSPAGGTDGARVGHRAKGRRFEARKSPGTEPAEERRDGGFRSDHGRQARPRRKDGKHDRRGADNRPEQTGALWIYGKHAALAAIRNKDRKIKRILVGESGLDWLNEAGLAPERRALVVKAAPFEIDRALHEGAVHQGLAVEVEALPRARLRETCAPDDVRRPVVVLDQITDPHNIGAIFRSAAAFGARAIIVQDRRTPPLAGALAKAAAGAVEIVPSIEVVNIARALEGLKDLGYFCAGLAGDATKPIGDIPHDKPVALVLGAEGAGLRRLVGETCDEVYRISLDPKMDSLNVSNAAAVALYEIGRGAA